jgi:predicted permease
MGSQIAVRLFPGGRGGAGRQDRRVLILNTLAPVFLLIGIGALMQRSAFVSPNFLREANRVTYWLGLPALLFSQLAGSFHDAGGAKLMLGTMLGATLLSIVAGYLVARAMRVPGEATGTFVQGAFRGNLAFVGLPIIYAMPDAPLAGGLTARTAAIITVAPMMVFYNVGGVVVLLLSQHAFGWAMVKPFAKQLLTTPPLLATVAGIGFALTGWPLPVAVDKTFSALGEMALPLGLLGVGGSLMTVQLGARWRAPLAAALVKTAVSPALGWMAGRWLGLAALELKMVMILMATPTAVVSYTMALELKGDEPLASGAIVLSVLTSIVTLAVIVGAF